MTDETVRIGGGSAWGTGRALDVRFAAVPDPAHRYRVDGLPGFLAAAVDIVDGGAGLPHGPALRFRPVVDPPGPFDLAGILFLTPFREAPGQRTQMVRFETRIGRRYYEFMAAVRWRYAAACAVDVVGLDLDVTASEVYSIDAADRAEAEALDAQTSPEPPDIVAFYEECRQLKVPGSGHRIWLFPPGTG
ncbi:MAG: hypothetical protein NVS9B8_05210 [Candidatus Limnocylindrales bacterium]